MRLIQKRSERGFTLLELSIVLVLLGVIAAMGLSSGKQILEAGRVSQTNSKMSAIKQAVTSYRKAYGRVPCPASLTLAVTSVNFGREGPKSANCIDGTSGNATATNIKSGNTVAEGAVPVRTLGLPDEFAFDGWGNRFRYAASVAYVATSAFATYKVNNTSAGAIQVNDAAGAARQSNAVFALVSMGPTATARTTEVER